MALNSIPDNLGDFFIFKIQISHVVIPAPKRVRDKLQQESYL